jgi:hypothetical protein
MYNVLSGAKKRATGEPMAHQTNQKLLSSRGIGGGVSRHVFGRGIGGGVSRHVFGRGRRVVGRGSHVIRRRGVRRGVGVVLLAGGESERENGHNENSKQFFHFEIFLSWYETQIQVKRAQLNTELSQKTRHVNKNVIKKHPSKTPLEWAIFYPFRGKYASTFFQHFFS